MKLTMLRGLPASGKSTFARKTVEDTGNSLRINRDDLRAMCFNSKWTGKREGFIKKAERALAKLGVEEGYNPIIDDTNLPAGNRESWSNFAKELGVKFEMKEFNEDLPTLIGRDSNRDNPVGPGAIMNMALRGGYITFLVNFIICDIDGTVADLSHRLRHIQADLAP